MGHSDRVRTGWHLATAAVRAWRDTDVSVPWHPLTGARLGRDLFVHGVSPAIGWAAGADRHPDAPALSDGYGYRLTQRQAEELTRGMTQVLRDRGNLAPGTAAALLGRNSAGFALAIAAVARTGADLVYLNPGFSRDQVADVCAARGVGVVLVDPDLADRVPPGIPTLDVTDPSAWAEPAGFRLSPGGGRHIILTSGTTGRPKGADRSRTPLTAVVSLLAVLPYRERDVHVLAAPMFHSWGWLNHRLNALLDGEEVMVARPAATAVLDAAAAHRAGVIVTTPVVVRRLAEAGPGDRDLSALRGVLVSGAPLPPDVVVRFRESFGDVLYNLYGSTEVGYATVATPADLATHPTTAGRALPGVRVVVLDPAGHEVPTGTAGDVWVGSDAAFDGYVDGGDKDRRADGLVATGDVGRLTDDGLLVISGRSDDLIISGGENVHPTEVEDVLRSCPGVADVAAVGRPDDTFGQAVALFVVATPDAPDDLAERVADFARRTLAPYQRPRDVVLVPDLPRNETGKVLRRAL